jgi:hypothetical protein
VFFSHKRKKQRPISTLIVEGLTMDSWVLVQAPALKTPNLNPFNAVKPVVNEYLFAGKDALRLFLLQR